MKTMMPGWLAVLMALVPAGSVLAHHSLASFDTTKAVRVKGTILRFHEINPHTFIYLEATGRGRIGTSVGRRGTLGRSTQANGFATDVLKPGTVVEVCGYLPKEPIVWQIASADPGPPVCPDDCSTRN